MLCILFVYVCGVLWCVLLLLGVCCVVLLVGFGCDFVGFMLKSLFFLFLCWFCCGNFL